MSCSTSSAARSTKRSTGPSASSCWRLDGRSRALLNFQVDVADRDRLRRVCGAQRERNIRLIGDQPAGPIGDRQGKADRGGRTRSGIEQGKRSDEIVRAGFVGVRHIQVDVDLRRAGRNLYVLKN